MQIIILGAGQVGSTLAGALVSEGHDVTVVDINPLCLEALQSHMDIRTLCGTASHPHVLKDAGADEADMLIAVTNSDEINMIACQAAYTLFRTPQKIARIRSVHYLQEPELFQNDALPIDVLIGPEQLVCDHIRALIEYPDAKQVIYFSHEHVIGLALTVAENSPAIGITPQEIPIVAKGSGQVALILRENIPLPSTEIKYTKIAAGDELFLVTTKPLLRDFMNQFRRTHADYERVIIAGGGNIGSRLAFALQDNFHLKLIDHSIEKSTLLASTLHDTIVLHGQASDKELLLDENIRETDIFCAVTNCEEVNIMSALLAKRLGCNKVMSLVNTPAYYEMMLHESIDTLISPKHATISALLTHIRRGDVVKAHALDVGGEAIEAVAHGNAESSQIVGRKIRDIQWPPGVLLAAIVRRSETLFSLANETIKADDHLILFVSDKKQIHATEQLFQVDVTFI